MSTTKRVRRAPLTERIKAQLDPWDFLLWLSEELNSNEWQESLAQWASPVGVVLNIIFMISRANVGSTSSSIADDIFNDYHERRGTGWLGWLVSPVYSLMVVINEDTYLFPGCLHRTPPHPPVVLERALHLLQTSSLPPLRTIHRPNPEYSFSSESPCRLVTRFIFAVPLPS